MSIIFSVLTNEEKLDTVLHLGLEKQYLENKDELIQFFMSIKSEVRKQDLDVRLLPVHNTEKNKCSICNLPANLNYINSGNIWMCMNHLKKGSDLM